MTMKMELSDFLAQHGIKHAATMANTTAVVVAVPRELDPIRLIGDEDKHATLLFFGETATLPPEAKATITDALEQASKLFNPFGESILDVSRLGPETPPALVAKLSNKCLTTIRSVIQINPQVREYLKNAQQFPQFTPHVTLGYPDYQGEADIKAQAAQVYNIQFDKLALWWNDEHIEFSLNQDMAENVQHGNVVTNFLAHHGIKGMKWGIRRSESTLDKAAGRKPGTDNSGKSRAGKGSMSKMKAGSVVTMLDEHGNPKTMIKKKDGTWHETFLSADAERLIKTSQKEGHELSTREIQEAVNRANFIKNYEAMFAPNPNAELQNRVNSLKLQKDYLQLHAELNPKRPSAVSRLVAGTAGAYSAYSKLDKVVGGELSKGLGKKLGDVLDPVAAANKLAKEASKDALDATKTQASVKKAVAEAQKASTEAQLAVLKLKKAQGGP